MRFNIIRLRAEMTRKEITQTALSEMTEISRPTINGICCGRACKTETGEKIAKALDVTLEELRERKLC